MHKIFIGNEELEINEEAFSFLVSILINYDFIKEIEFVLDDIFISPILPDETLTNILSVIYASLKLYTDNLINNLDADIINRDYLFEDLQNGALASTLVRPSYKLIIKIDSLLNSLNAIVCYRK